VVLAMESSGLHSNGYSLVRHVLLGRAGWTLDREVPELGRALGAELLEPTRVYALDCLALVDAVEVHAMSHITGGGLANNLARVVPDACSVTIERSTWSPAPIFGLVQQVGEVRTADLEATLNLGVGMVAVLPADAVDAAVSLLAGRGLRSWVCGTVGSAASSSDRTAAGGGVSLVGEHPRG
jgi:phosphoribosylformylglycinamidine cyclo-ligase